MVREFLAEILPSPVDVVGDMQIALEAALGSGPGVVVIAGTGSIAYGRDRDGRTVRAGGWGFAIGDEGSAHWIGRTAVNVVLHASDESDELRPSTLTEGLFRAWGVRSVLDLARAANSVPPPDFASLFRAVVASQDDLASQILASAGRELARTARVVITRLFAGDEVTVVPVAMTGGVFRHSELVRDSFYNEMRKLDARSQVKLDVVDPVAGALRMARNPSTGSHSA
jgi:glucosamine kinase